MSRPTTTADALAIEHLPLVGAMVRARARSLPSHVDVDDLHQAGALAVVLAARRFDGSRGVPFGAYARRVIDGAITDHLRSLDWATRAQRRDGTAPAGPLALDAALERGWEPVAADDPARVIDRVDVARAVATLTLRQRQVITAALADEPQVTTARRLGVPESRITQTKAAAYRRLRHHLTA